MEATALQDEQPDDS